ncbi:MAG: cupin domain-containing protein, partial [Bacteroidota bacterium]|nr:cupin domain-containing protein [Bacteroidota bacterium]
VYRFEGASDPEDQSVLYAISSVKGDMKGVLVNGYGISADAATDAIIARLKTHPDHPVGLSLFKKEIMKNKSNEATPLRPEGDRLLNASLVEIDLNKFIAQLKEEITWADSDRNSISVFKSDNMAVVLIGLHAKAELKTHIAKGHINVQVLDGEIKFTAQEQTISMKKGVMISLQENIPHSVLAVKESFFLLTMMNNDQQP